MRLSCRQQKKREHKNIDDIVVEDNNKKTSRKGKYEREKKYKNSQQVLKRNYPRKHVQNYL